MNIRLILFIASFIATSISIWFIYHSIEKSGYERCQVAYAENLAAAKEKSRQTIVKVEKVYVPINKKIIRQDGPNDPVGPRVELAIDSLPEPRLDGQ